MQVNRSLVFSVNARTIEWMLSLYYTMNMWIGLEEQLQALLISKTVAGEFSACLFGRITSVENFHTYEVLQEMKHAGWQMSSQYALTLRNERKKICI
jgi:hypothetical protein